MIPSQRLFLILGCISGLAYPNTISADSDHATITHGMALVSGLTMFGATTICLDQEPLPAAMAGVAACLLVDLAVSGCWAHIASSDLSNAYAEISVALAKLEQTEPATEAYAIRRHIQELCNNRWTLDQLEKSINRQAEERSWHILGTLLPCATECNEKIVTLRTALDKRLDAMVANLHQLIANKPTVQIILEGQEMTEAPESDAKLLQETISLLEKSSAALTLEHHLHALKATHRKLAAKDQLCKNYKEMLELPSFLDMIEASLELKCQLTSDSVAACASSIGTSPWPLIELRNKYLDLVRGFEKTANRLRKNTALYGKQEEAQPLLALINTLQQRVQQILCAIAQRNAIANQLLQDPSTVYHQQLLRYEEHLRYQQESKERANMTEKITNALQTVQAAVRGVEERTNKTLRTVEDELRKQTQTLSSTTTKVQEIDAALQRIGQRVTALENQQQQQPGSQEKSI